MKKTRVTAGQHFYITSLLIFADVFIKVLLSDGNFTPNTNPILFLVLYNIFYAFLPYFLIAYLYFIVTSTINSNLYRAIFLLMIVIPIILLRWYMADRGDIRQLFYDFKNYLAVTAILYIVDITYVRRLGITQ